MTTTARGYGSKHQRLRRRYQRKMDRGEVFNCWRCGDPVDPSNWDLGHDDQDRSITRGPEHPLCNRATRSRWAKRERPTEPHPGLRS